MTAEECAARLEIQHLIASWSMGSDQGELASWIWAEDAVVHAPGGIRIAGRDNILGRFEGRRYTYTVRGSDTPVTTDVPPIAAPAGETAEPTWLRHNITTSLIKLEGPDAAAAQSYFLVISNDGLIGSGRYEDRFRRIGGSWKLAERKTRLEYIPAGEKWDGARAIAAADRAGGN